jgi:hypothetical protein
MSQSEALEPVILNLNLPTADTEGSLNLPDGCKFFSFQCRQNSDLRFAFETGKVASSISPYATLKAGNAHSLPEKGGYNTNSSTDSTNTVYFASSDTNVDVEMVCWKDIRRP